MKLYLLMALFVLFCGTATASDCDIIAVRLFGQIDEGVNLSAGRGKFDQLIVQGGQRISGAVDVSPAKNAYLPIIAAALLNKNPVLLKEVPKLRDIETFLTILKKLGVKVEEKGQDVILDASSVKTNVAVCELVSTMRASVVLLGPLLARFGAGKVSLPGGCPIGARPIDIHLKSLKKLGAEVDEQEDFVAVGAEALKPNTVELSFPSVGATQNLIMASVFTEGKTVLKNIAQEPEIDDLIGFLNNMGANVQRSGDTITIQGVKELAKNTSYKPIGDRIEAATWIMAALMSKSELTVKGVDPEHIASVLEVLMQMGAKFEIGDDFVKVLKVDGLTGTSVTTAPHPGFPTDAQAQLMALMTTARGPSSITETIFEGRMQHVAEMRLAGASIDQPTNNRAVVNGPTNATGANVICTDLRAGAALLMLALNADGPSTLNDIYYIDRGYDQFIEKLQKMGVCRVERINK